VALGGVERLERRDAGCIGPHQAGAECAQLIEQQQRVGAHRKGIAGEPDTQPPDGWRRGGGGGALGWRDAGGDFHDRAELGQDRLAVGVVGRIGLLDQAPDVVPGGERRRDQRAARLRLALANQVERGLDVMGEAGHAVEAEHRAGALDGVQGTECGVDQIGVGR